MNSLNSILIEGNLVRDSEMHTTQRGTTVCTFQIATNRFYKKDSNMEKEVGFFNVETWGKMAEKADVNGQKGRGVRVVGRLKQDRWHDKDGKTQSKVVIVAEHVEFRPDFQNKHFREDESDIMENTENTENLIPIF